LNAGDEIVERHGLFLTPGPAQRQRLCPRQSTP
jgi:hypothetical protein